LVDLTLKLACKLGLKESELVHVQRGVLLHDFGKMTIPNAILRKPEPLSEEEWGVMRKHPEYARTYLMKISFLALALDIPYCHHEKWDGTGYPRGLKGEEIPFSARIFAVVDVWDALISDRPYRQAWSREKALEYIREQSGKYFDPCVVKAFDEMQKNL
jgi:HD-GYP domain-containing protein (c-di-GMP phosphodiesterase class II)